MGLVYVGTVALAGVALATPYREVVHESFHAAVRELPAHIARWRAEFAPQPWQEFAPPREPAALAALAAALYAETQQREYVGLAFRWIALYDTLRQLYPENLRQLLPQYRRQVPPVPDFFAFPLVCRAYMGIREALPSSQRQYLQQLIAASAEHLLSFPEWGAHNRAVLKALGLELAAQACPEHPQAPAWRRVASALVAESRTSWTLEDAQLYWGIWLYALLLYGQYADSTLWQLPQLALYAEAAFQLLAPFGAVAPFGDTRNPGETAAEFIALFEWAAARWRYPHYRWAARRLFERWVLPQRPLPPYRALILWDAARWADTTLEPLPPSQTSRLWCSEDAIVKKLVFRTGWDSLDTYLMLTYRESPPYGWRARQFLHQSLPIEEEKGSHGHSDELSLEWFLHRGALLLTPPGYREGVPSGPYGAYRAEYFHNRLVVRPARPDAGQSLWEFLRHAGTHRPAETTKLDAWEFHPLSYARLRLQHSSDGYRWERLVLVLHDPLQLLVADIVELLREGPFTAVQLWHGTAVVHAEKNRCVLSTDAFPSLAGDTSWVLAILALERPGQRDTLFPLRRAGRNGVTYARWQTGYYRAGERLLFLTRLVPVQCTTCCAGLGRDSVAFSSDSRGFALRLRQDTSLWFFLLQWDPLGGGIGDGRRPQYDSTARTLALEGLRSDADFAFVRQTPAALHYGLTYGTFLSVGSRTLFQAPPGFFPLQLDGSPPRIAPLQWRAWEETLSP